MSATLNTMTNLSTAVPTVWSFSLHWLQAGMWVGGLVLILWAAFRMRWPKLVALLVFLTMDLVMFGAFVRLTDSGLGCPDWPGCYAHFTPAQAHHQINEAVAEQGGTQGNVSPFKAWVEMIHRYVATIIGTLILAMAIRASWARKHGKQIALGLPFLLLGWVILQGLFGAWTVTLLLTPLIVTLHLMGGIILLMLAVWFWMQNRSDLPKVSTTVLTQTLVWAAMLTMLWQIFLGGWVSTNYAALACTGFPTCNGSFQPDANWAQGFTFWRNLGENPNGSAISLQALVAIQWGHRLFAVLTSIIVLAATWRMSRYRELRKLALWISGLLFVQIALGASVVIFAHPLELAVAHNGVAALMMLLLTIAVYRVSRPESRRLVIDDAALAPVTLQRAHVKP
ncbi:putative Cytochrome oxidase assembly protein [Thiomonas sp. X19]|nr:putative Cytochrome oxidase assembly protein [Thiomonas sp. X19]